MNGRYVLNEDLEVVPAGPLLAWAASMGDMHRRRVAETTLPDGRWVSTVFLGLDHGFAFVLDPENPPRPVVFETMVFEVLAPGERFREDLDMERYCTWDEAFAGHYAMVARWTIGRALGPIGGDA